jgi:hypothetical protein
MSERKSGHLDYRMLRGPGQCRIFEKYSSILLTAHRIISLPRRNRVAFGLNRTLSRIYDGVDASRRHRCAKVKVLSTT